MSVVGIEDVKKYLKITRDHDDDTLQQIIDAAEAKIGMRIPLDPAEVRTSVVTPNGSYLVLPWSPVVELTSITPNVGDALDVDLLVANGGVVEYIVGAGTFPATSYTIVYKAGYPDPPGLPHNLKLAIYELVRHLWRPQRGNQRPGSPQSDAPSNTVPGASFLMPNRVTELLADFELPGFA